MLRKDKNAKTTTFIHNEDIIVINKKQLEKLKKEADCDPLGRARICLHKSHDDLVQEMIIAFRKGSVVEPHRHKNRSESFHIIEGEVLLEFFNNNGRVIRRIKLSASGEKKPFIYRLSSDIYHRVRPLSAYVILHETITGPYNRISAEFAPWTDIDAKK